MEEEKRKCSKRLSEKEEMRRSQLLLKQIKMDDSNGTTLTEDFLTNKLPDEILIFIFQKLPYHNRLPLEFVCKRWKKLAKKNMWNDVKMLRFSQWTPQKHKINAIIERAGVYLQELCVEEIHWSGILSRLPEMPNLRHISLCGKGDIMLTNKQLERIAEYFQNLQSLNLWKCLKFEKDSNSSSQNSSLCLSMLLSKCAALEYLCLGRAINIRTAPFQPTVLPPKLVFLETDDTFDLETVFKIANEKCQNIRCLSLQFLKPTIPSLEFVHENMLKKIVHLELDFHKAPQASFFENFSKTLVFLGNLKVLRVAKITGEALLTAIDCCPNLEDLGYSAYGIDILAAFLSLPKLTKLRFLIICHHGKMLKQISTQKCAKCNENCDETSVGRSLKRIAQNGALEFLSLNFTISVGLMNNLVKLCKCLTSLFCPIVRYQPLASLCQCMTELNQHQQMKINEITTAKKANGPIHLSKRTLNISVNFQKSRTLAHPYIRFLHMPDLGSNVVRQLFEQLFTSVPNFLFEQPESIDDYEDEGIE